MRGKRMKSQPNILVIRLGLLGDMMCTTPMLEAIKKHFPAGRLALLSNEYNQPVVTRNPYLDKLYTYIHTKNRARNPRSGLTASIIDAMKLKRDLKRERFDWIVICNGGFNKPSVRIAQKLGGKIISATREDGTYEYRIDYPILGLLEEPIKHEVVRTFRLLEPLGINADELPSRLTLTPDSGVLAKMRSRFDAVSQQPSIAIHISARDPRREWPIERFSELIHEIKNAVPVHFWIIHAPSDAERAQKLSADLNGIYHQLVAPADTESLIATLALSSLVVCQEGGILHLAAGLQKPVVGLFENTTEKILGWYPWGVQHRIVTNPMPAGLIKDISPIEVAAAVVDLYKEAEYKP